MNYEDLIFFSRENSMLQVIRKIDHYRIIKLGKKQKENEMVVQLDEFTPAHVTVNSKVLFTPRAYVDGDKEKPDHVVVYM